MNETWERTWIEFRRVAAKEGIDKVAAEVPADRATIYRLIRGDTERPTRAVRAGIERIVEDRKGHKP